LKHENKNVDSLKKTLILNIERILNHRL